MPITYTYESVKFNRTNGFFATQWIDGVYSGKQFGRTKSDAVAAFDE